MEESLTLGKRVPGDHSPVSSGRYPLPPNLWFSQPFSLLFRCGPVSYKKGSRCLSIHLWSVLAKEENRIQSLCCFICFIQNKVKNQGQRDGLVVKVLASKANYHSSITGTHMPRYAHIYNSDKCVGGWLMLSDWI